MRPTVFINALREEDKGSAVLAQTVAVHTRDDDASVRIIDSGAFSEIPGSPFSYRSSETIRSTFVRFDSFESEDRHVRQGLATADEAHFLRLRWEVAASSIVTGSVNTTPGDFRSQTRHGRPWVPLARGGEEASFYRSLHFVVNWREDGAEITDLADPVTGKRRSRPQNQDFYFRRGFFQTLRARQLSPTLTPVGCIFSNNGFQAFVPDEESWSWLAYLNSSSAEYLFQMQVGRYGYALYNPGTLQRTPAAPLPQSKLGELGRQLCNRRLEHLRRIETAPEFSHPFRGLPTCAAMCEVVTQVRLKHDSMAAQELHLRKSVDILVDKALGLSDVDRDAIAASRQERLVLFGGSSALNDASVGGDPSADSDTEDDEAQADNLRSTTVSLLSYAVGCAFGRWDIRYATGEKTPPELPDPFAPLPVCSPGMLQGEDGLPLSATPPGYPLRINWNGILVHDAPDTNDIVRRVRDVLRLLWPDTSESIEAEMCDALGVKDLRDYFRKPGSGGFWMDHVHMYSKSHRKAPIYWLLQSSHKNYGIWLYYQRLDSDLLFKVLQNYVEPKLKLEQNHETEASHKLTAGGLSVSETRQAQKDLEKQQDLVAEIRNFRDTLKKAADLRLTPDLDDGVVLNIAPLHELVPWVEAAKYWDELLAGKYPWSSVGKQLEQKGMV